MKKPLYVLATLALLATLAWAAPRVLSTGPSQGTGPSPSSDASDGHTVKTVTLSVPGITCETCPITVKMALARVTGVSMVDVDFDSRKAVVVFDEATTSVAALVRATAEAGYPSSVRE